jgi:hypothetical protein
MSLQVLLFFLLLQPILLRTNYRAPSRSDRFTLGPNLIVNGNLSTPVIQPPLYWANYPREINGWRTKVKNVEYISGIIWNDYSCNIFFGIRPEWQFLDTDSINSN